MRRQACTQIVVVGLPTVIMATDTKTDLVP